MFASLHKHAHAAIAAGIGLALVGAMATPIAASAATEQGPRVIINEAYLKGGSAGAFYSSKFVELYNAGDAAQDLSNWSLQYRPASGTAAASGVLPLSGSIAAGDYYLIQLPGNNNGASGAALPQADLEGTLNPAGQNGTLWLADTKDKLTLPTGAAQGAAHVVDLLGYGSSNTFEGTVGPDAGGNTTPNALVRTNFVDTDDNGKDFTVTTTVTPQASGSSSTPDPEPTGEPTPDPTGSPSPQPTETPDVVAISAIQGTGATSPLDGKTVTTRGIVTAAYPTGGFRGFYIQTPGTGGAIDLGTHTASDGLFVYGADAVAKVAIGDYVEVTGAVSEYKSSATATGTLTELSASAANVTKLNETVAPVTPATVAWPATEEQRESLEGMLLLPQGSFTVSNTYQVNFYGWLGLAAGETPLTAPTELGAVGSDAYNAAVADNAARGVLLDDGASDSFTPSGASSALPLPYLTAENPVRVGSGVTFTKPVILDYRFDAWGFQPLERLTGANAATVQPVTFSTTRPGLSPANVGGDIQLASFNVLNYFTTTGADFGCTSYYRDRANNPIAINDCGTGSPRGAANAVNLARQQAKIVAAINGLGAEVVSLEEIENSAKFGKDRDAALATLVGALNAALGSEEWAYVPSPPADALPSLDAQDVIRTAFIYKKAAVTPVGASAVDTDSAFANARQPLAQAFAKAGSTVSAFVAIVNHFKSKGDSKTPQTGDNANGPQGAFNGDRTRQAQSLLAFADRVKTAAGTDRVFLMGDFNAYTQEDPMRILHDAGYVEQGAKSGKYSYSFSGMNGSLDHVLASPAANAAVTGADIWNINAPESVALEYSRYNYNATNYYDESPYRSSDHDPVVVGIDLSDTVELNLLNINDFHGRIDANTVKFAGTVEQLRAAHENTLLLSAGDNIGASLFASAMADDQPTIDVLNALEMTASAVGNHEFDKGFADLTGRVVPAAKYSYLGANVYRKGTVTPVLPEYKIVEQGGLRIAVIGVVTKETASLVSPGGIADIEFGDPVDAVNRVAGQLQGKADVIIAEYHDGASEGTPEKATLEQEVAAGGEFAKIVTQTSPSVDVIFTGHTHKEYAWDAPVPGTDRTRPVIQTGSYGENIGQVVLKVDRSTGDVRSYEATNVDRVSTPTDDQLKSTYPRVAKVAEIVDAALAKANEIGSQPVGSVTADITTAFSGGSYANGVYTGGKRDDRASQSTLGNLVADSLVASLSDPDRGGAQIGVVNPGGLRAELLQAPDGVITYAEANAVLPFVNNLWTTTLTGAQFKDALEQQWQPDGSARPYLQLGLSANVRYTYDASAPRGSRITGIWIDGKPIDPAGSYRIGSFNFLLQGGDNFTAFAGGTGTRDSGLIDRDAWIDYLKTHANLAPNFASSKAQVTGVPSEIRPGETVSLRVSGFDLTSLGSPQNTTLLASIEGSTTVFDPITVIGGEADVALTIPADAPANSVLVLHAPQSGTEVRVALNVLAILNPGEGGTGTGSTPPTTAPTPPSESSLTATAEGRITIAGTVVAGGTITVNVGAKHAGEWVTVWLFSTPQQIGGWYQVDADGNIRVTLPSDVTGSHRLVVLDANGTVIGWQAITIAAPARAGGLAATGGEYGDVGALLLLVALLAGAGVTLRVAARRRA